MTGLSELARRLRALAKRRSIDREVEAEMRLHVELRERRLREQGLSAGDAETTARRRFGNARKLRQDAIDALGWRWLDEIGQDVRFAVRMLVRQPMFAATAVITLALAIGATTSIFSVLDAVVLKPLPFANPDRLVQVHGRNWREDRGGPPDPVTGPIASSEVEAYQTQAAAFEGFAPYEVAVRHLDSGSGVLDRLNAVIADASLFSLLGVEAAIGRTFQARDNADVAVISDRLWRDRFNANTGVLNSTIRLDGHPYTVIGVMPERFQFPYRAASLLPAALPETRTDAWLPLAAHWRGRLSVVGRLKPGVDIAMAAAELRVIAARLEQQSAGGRTRVGVRVRRLSEIVIDPVRGSLWMLFAAVALVLLAACANVANLLLARMSVRTREVVTRAALGAGRLRLARQFLTESLLLALLGGLGAIVVARWGVKVLSSLAGARLPRAHEISFDWRGFAFLLLACGVTAVLFGLAPAAIAARANAQTASKDAAGHATMGRRFAYLRDGLAVLEIALAFVLAFGAAAIVREIVRLRHVDAGINTEHVAVLHLTPKLTAADYQAIEDRISHVPGVLAAGFVQMVPLQNWGWEADFNIQGRAAEPGVRRTTELRYVTPGYFHAMGIPILRGRGFLPSDTSDAPPVVVVNDALARRYLAGQDPIGVVLDRGTIVGVSGDVRSVHLDRPAAPELYYPAAQNLAMTSDLGMSLVARTESSPERLVPSLRSTIREVMPAVAIFNVGTMDQIVDDSLGDLHLYRWLIGLFAGLTVLLAAIGLHGVISYMTAARTREFAIRIALGSRQGALMRGVVSRGVALTLGGIACGAPVTFLLGGVMRRLSIGTSPDAITNAGLSLALLAIAVLASAVPAMRAAGVDPASALRHE